MADYTGRHPSDADERDPGFCRCGLGLDAWVHTDTKRYTETPLTREVWNDLRGGPDGSPDHE
ncbi:hypothetical protein F9C11_21635 [Amycolatopsis sp. VS8301801F10]|uniref:hypothetical protein n=1 Tax=Amycolatopsis sp. VS8301801F10 TaxID=2652442 RepID=UPI0038FCD7A9